MEQLKKLLEIIQEESGVRNLEREISKVQEKLLKKLLMVKKKS